MDKKVIKQFKAGDAEAFDAIYRYYNAKMFHFALGLVKDHEIAKDLVQEVFVALWEKREQVDPDLNFDNYIFTITYNAIRKFFRNRSIESRVMIDLFRDSPAIEQSADREIIYKELFNLAATTIDKLPPKRKTVYRLSRQEGMKIREIASKMNISPRTAEHQLAKALKYLKEELSGFTL